MKINFTIELDQESIETLQTPFLQMKEEISDFLKSFKPSGVTVQENPVPEENKTTSAQPDNGPETKEVKSKKNRDKKVKKTKASKRKPRASKKPKQPKITVVSTVLETIKAHAEGINSENIKTQTGLNAKQVADTVYRLKRTGQIQKTEGGVFVVV